MMSKIPVTVLCGFLGSGKTTLLNHILKNKGDKKIAMIVNDMASVNIDGANIEDKIIESKEKLVQMQNGCICCTLREDLFKEIKKITEEGGYDYLVIEASGISEPMPIAATFTFSMEDGKNLKDVAKLDTMVSVVDACNFSAEYNSTETLKDRKQQISEFDERLVVDLMIDQLEFANVVLVNKADLVSKEELEKVHKMIRSINSECKIIDTINSNAPLEEIMNTNKFDFVKAQQYPTWVKEMERGQQHTSEDEEYGISSFVYRAKKPFNPERFVGFIDRVHPGLVRAKGYFWIANKMDEVGEFQLAGKLKECSLAGNWWATCPKSEWPEGVEKIVEPFWDEEAGDRRQELVFIGIDLDKEKMTKELDECLLKDGEKGVILQRDKKTYGIAPHIPGGMLTAEMLKKFTAIAQNNEKLTLKITSAARIAIFKHSATPYSGQ
jgi:G3E family GTPase